MRGGRGICWAAISIAVAWVFWCATCKLLGGQLRAKQAAGCDRHGTMIGNVENKAAEPFNRREGRQPCTVGKQPCASTIGLQYELRYIYP
jgi:hypothetical protein